MNRDDDDDDIFICIDGLPRYDPSSSLPARLRVVSLRNTGLRVESKRNRPHEY